MSIKKNLIFQFVFIFTAAVLSITRSGAEENIFGATPAAGDFSLVADGAAANILVDEADYKVVLIAAGDLAGDVESVTGIKPTVIHSADSTKGRAVIVGTLGKSRFVREMIDTGKLDVSAIKGEWESFIITVVETPLPGMESALVIAGSDRRGTAFGVYEVARQAGVNPWSWWADVPVKKRNRLVAKAGTHKFGPPSVKYRGIFLNDEDFGLKPWSEKTFEPEVGDIGPKTYAEIFELLLRLKANYIWPAMHKCTHAFNHYPENKVVADDYAIVMGASHCELMLRNNVDEWKHDERGKWDWTSNKDSMTEYWEERVKENGQYENIYTIGLRGVHDSPMEGSGTLDERTDRMLEIFDVQRGLLAKHVNEDVTRVPQVFCPYKEVLEIYRNDLEVPEDVTLLWVDDNFGFIRQLSTPQEQARPGGSGVYYHISYWGPPHDYLWLNTTPPALVWEEMKKAYDFNAREVWIVNVGDIKPGEIGTDLFLQMGWDIDRWTIENIPDFLEEWAGEVFGDEYSAEIADILNRYYILNFQRKPEHMGFYKKYTLKQYVQNPDFSLYNYGDEAQKRIDAFDELQREAEATNNKLPETARDAYFQLVLYPVRATSFLNKKILYSYKSRIYDIQKRTSTNDYGEKTKEGLQAVEEDTDYYNHTIANGKWKHMMSSTPNGLPVFTMPSVRKIEPEEAPGLGILVEGMKKAVRHDSETTKLRLPQFNRFTQQKYFIDLFNTGTGEIEWTVTPDANWILPSETSGKYELEKRIWIEVDYGRAPTGKARGKLVVKGAGAQFSVMVQSFNPDDIEPAAGTFIQDNGVISIYAESAPGTAPGSDMSWKKIPGLGRTGASMALMPFTAPPVDESRVTDTAPALEYPIYVFSPGKAKVIVHAIPTHEIHKGRFLKCAVSIDDGEPAVLEFAQSQEEADQVWKNNVLNNTMIAEAVMEIPAGTHTLKLWGTDPSVVLDNIFVDFGGLRKSYLGPAETVFRSSE